MVPLTYTEEQILAYIREGRFDAEIGVRLGLSVGDVQRRIEGICSKYGVRDRAALRAYVEAVPVSADIAANASEPVISPRHSRIRSLGPALLAGTAALGVSAVALVVLFSSSGTNDESSLYDELVRDLSLVSPVPPTPTLPANLTPLSTPALTMNGVTAKVAVYQAPMSLPPDIEIIYTAHADTEERPVRVMRTYQRGKKTDVLYEPPPGYTFINAIAAADGSDIVVAICANCPPAAGPPVFEFHRSHDAGITWSLMGTVTGTVSGPRPPHSSEYAWAVAFDGNDIVIGIAHGQKASYERLTTREAAVMDNELPILWTDATFATAHLPPSGNSISVGSQRYTLLPAGGETAFTGASFFGPEGVITSSWYEVATGDGVGYLGVFDDRGFARFILNGGKGSSFAIAGWIDPVYAIGSIATFAGGEPVIIRPDLGWVHPIIGLPGSRDFESIVAIRHGPAAVVKPGAAPCLPMYEQPDTNSVVIACAAPGVRLLASGLRTRIVAGRNWYAMAIGRFGRIGWVEPVSLTFDDPQFSPERNGRYGNTLAVVRPAAGAECAPVRSFANESEKIVSCLPANMVVGHALSPLGTDPDRWFGVFYASNCYPTTGCRGEAIGFMRAAFLELQR